MSIWDGGASLYQESFYFNFFQGHRRFAETTLSKWFRDNPSVREIQSQLGWPLSVILLDPAISFHIKSFIESMGPNLLSSHSAESLRQAFSDHLGTVTLFRAQVESENANPQDIVSPLFFQDPGLQKSRVDDLFFPVVNEHIHTATSLADAARKLSNQESTHISVSTPEHVEKAKIATVWFTGEGKNPLLSQPGYSLFLFELIIPRLYTIQPSQVAHTSKWPQYIVNDNGHRINLEADGVELLVPFFIPASWIVHRSPTNIPERYRRVD